MPYEPILWGIALAATAGLRAFMPFVFVGGMARYAHMPTPDMLAGPRPIRDSCCC